MWQDQGFGPVQGEEKRRIPDVLCFLTGYLPKSGQYDKYEGSAETGIVQMPRPPLRHLDQGSMRHSQNCVNLLVLSREYGIHFIGVISLASY